MFKEWLKQFLAMVLCVITLLTPITEAYAKNYVSSDSDGDFTYYIVEGKDVKDLFDLTLGDIPNILDWILDFKSYTVIKKYKDRDGDTVYKCYFNTPNLQSIVKNSVISIISDGYTDDTYDINETEWIVPVGKNADSENAITKYGFNIPNYTYMGEYPKEVMSPAGIVPSPKKWWEVLWRAIKTLFGVSFLKAPDADNFNSIKYNNHTYTDRSDYILEYFKDYYLKYFENQITKHSAYDAEDKENRLYFDSPEHVMELTVTEDAKRAAENYNEKYNDYYIDALEHYIWWYAYSWKDDDIGKPANSTVGLASNTGLSASDDWFDVWFKMALPKDDTSDEFSVGTLFGDKWNDVKNTNVGVHTKVYGVAEDRVLDGWHFIASREKYKNKFYSWLMSNPENLKMAYVLVNSIPDSVMRYKYKETQLFSNNSDAELNVAEDYGLTTSSFDKGPDDDNLVSLAADIVRYSHDTLMTHFKYDVQNQEQKVTNTRYDTTTTYYTVFENVTVRHYLNGSNGYKYVDSDGNGTNDKDKAEYEESELTDVRIDGFRIDPDSTVANQALWGWWNQDVDNIDTSNQWTDNPFPGINNSGAWVTDSTQVNLDQDTLYKDAESWIDNPASHYEVINDNPSKVEGTQTGPSVTYDTEVVGSIGRWWVQDGQTGKFTITNNNGTTDYYMGTYDPDHYTYYINEGPITSYKWTKTETYSRVDTKTYTRRGNYRVESLWDGRGDYANATVKIETLNYQNPVNRYKTFLSNYDFDRYNVQFVTSQATNEGFNMDDIVHPDLQAIYTNINRNKQLISNFKKFNRYMARGADYDPNSSSGISNLLYRQCMITNQGEDTECWSKEYGDDKTTITLANVLVYSGVYKITEKYRNNGYSGSYAKLSDSDAHTILTQLQIYCGPYYSDVLSNMMKLMAACAKGEGDSGPLTRIVEDDPRVMPYDDGTMVKNDKVNYTVVDPRTQIYKDHIIGNLIANLTLGGGIGIFLKVQSHIVKLAGKITEVSVFLQTICDFDLIDSLGLSPATFWGNSAWVNLLILLVVAYFIIKTVLAVIKLGTKGSARVIIGFLLLILELGSISYFVSDPDGTWKKIKDINNKVISLGEMSVIYNYPSLQYLFGDAADYEVAYYLPYLDTWSKYNTGYGLMDTEQHMESTDIELDDTFFNPQIDGNDIEHYSILLADAFSYYGRSNSVLDTITDPNTGETINGETINNNAYRVVDHFMAPRVTIGTSGSNLTLKVTENENYNGEFQTGLGDILVKLANCILICFLSLIKLMIFIYFWWQLYLFIFNVILGVAAERKKFTTILLETFTPLFALLLFGLYTGICMMIGMTAEGLFGFFLIVFMFWLTLMIIRWWHDAKQGQLFPFTLGWIYLLISLSAGNRLREQQRLKDQTEIDSRQSGVNLTDEELEDPTKHTQKFFDANGVMKNEYANDYNRYHKDLENWYQRMQRVKKSYRPLTAEEQAAVTAFENNEKYRDTAEKIRQQIEENGYRGGKKEKTKKITEQPNQESQNTPTPKKQDPPKKPEKITKKEDAGNEKK